MNKKKWLSITKVVQAIGITLIGVFFVFNTSVYILFIGAFISIVSSLIEGMLSYFMNHKRAKPIPLLASFLKIVVVLAIVFRGLFQDTELSLVSFVILVITVIVTLIFQLYVALAPKRSKDPNTLDN